MTIFKMLRNNYNKDKALAMKKYMRNQFEFIGIPSPERKQIFKEYFNNKTESTINWQFISDCWQQPEREFQYLAIDYLTKYKSLLVEEDIYYLKSLIIKKVWWDTVDAMSKIFSSFVLLYPNLKNEMLAYSLEENFWLRRIAIIHQLGFKEQTDTHLLAKIIINNFSQHEFFINKAIGWALRDYSKVNAQWVRDFIIKYEADMANLSVIEAMKWLKNR